jgi:hypothetical protein
MLCVLTWLNQPNEPLCMSALPALRLRLSVRVAHIHAKKICTQTQNRNTKAESGPNHMVVAE